MFSNDFFILYCFKRYLKLQKTTIINEQINQKVYSVLKDIKPIQRSLLIFCGISTFFDIFK